MSSGYPMGFPTGNFYLRAIVLTDMGKFLLIVGLVGYVIYKIGSFFFRAGAASQQFRQQRRPEREEKQSRKGTIRGGDYIDYEEVK